MNYEEIVNRYIDVVYCVAVSYCQNTYDAEDVVQNTFIKFLNTKTEFEDEEHLRKWLIRVAVNECRSIWRSFWNRNVTRLEEAGNIPEFDTKESRELFEIVRMLPAKYRIVVHLYYYEEYSIRRIAKVLHIKETTIQTRLMRARNMLRQQLKEAWQ